MRFPLGIIRSSVRYDRLDEGSTGESDGAHVKQGRAGLHLNLESLLCKADIL